MNEDVYRILKSMVDVLDAYENTKETLSNQGQAMDGFSALANFLELAKEARRLTSN